MKYTKIVMFQRSVMRHHLIQGTSPYGKWWGSTPFTYSPGYFQKRGLRTDYKPINGVDAPTDTVKAFQEIPGPRSLPYIGTLYKYLPLGEYSFMKPYDSDVKRFNKYGPIVREELLPGINHVHIFDPEDMATMYRNEGKNPSRLDVYGLRAYRHARGMSQGLANLNGEAWQRLRSQVQKKMMRKANAAAYIPAQAPIADEFTERMRLMRDENGEIPNFLNELYKWAMESIGVVCFDSRLGTFDMDQAKNADVQRLIKAVGGIFEGIYKTTFLAELYKKWPKAPTMRRLFDDLDFLVSFSNKCAERALERVATGKEMLIPAEDSLLLALVANPNLARDEALSMISDLLTGGIDSTAHTMAFNINNLAINPQCQKKLQAEIDQFAPRGSTVTQETLQKMKYLVAVTKETSRLTPTTAGTTRTMVKDIVLSGYHIPAGTDIFVGSTVTSRLAKYYDEPDTFRPERWERKSSADDTDSADGTKTTAIQRFSVLPFGHGPRMCIGRRFAEQEVWLGLIKIFQEFNVEYQHEPIGHTTRIFNVPDRPLRFKFIDRH